MSGPDEHGQEQAAPQTPPNPPAPELMLLPGETRWHIMSPIALRTTGMPARWFDTLSGAGYFENGQVCAPEEVTAIAGDPVFRAAVHWQNPPLAARFDKLARPVTSHNANRRQLERVFLRYLVRYLGKAETIGFFGPLGFARLSGEPGHVRQRPGEHLISRRKTFPEAWTIRALASALEADLEGFAGWLPLRRRFQTKPYDPPLTDAEQAVLDLCDGVRPRREIDAGVAAALLRRRVIAADANLPLSPRGLPTLEARVAAIGDEKLAGQAREKIAVYRDALDTLGAAGGDADAVAAAQQRLSAVFQHLTGTEAARRGGKAYAGRGLAYEECLRDTDMELGRDFLERIAAPLSGLATVAQWLTWETAAVYREHFARAWAGGPHPLPEVWYAILNAFHGKQPRPLDSVLADFRRRWNRLIAEPHTAESFKAACLRDFPSPRPGWPTGAVHSPDLQIAEHFPGGVASGAYDVILGELHIATTTMSGPVFEWPYADYELTRFMQRRTGGGYLPVFPDHWPRNTGRTVPMIAVDGEFRYAFADVEGAPAGTVSAVDIRVAVRDGAPVVLLPDGEAVPMAEFFDFFLSSTVIDLFKTTEGDADHSPRRTVGGLVLARETWRPDVAGQPVATVVQESEAWEAAQLWRTGLGLPDHVYVKVGGEVKPFYVDFTSPLSTLSFLHALRASLRTPGTTGRITVSEALPGPDQAWVVDAQGERYHGEVRMVLINQES